MRQHTSTELLGVSRAIRELREEVERVALCDAKVLISGETGVGKDVVAQMVHRRGPSAHRPFVPLNCAGVPETLLESELFGHVKGSFTGAYRDKAGKLEVARGGTMFLDEVGEMSLRMQGLLLRFLETGELQKVGADRSHSGIEVRIIASTNRDLRSMVTQGTFREDLFYRLNVIHISVPPLRKRREDIPAMVDHFLLSFARNNGGLGRAVSPEAVKLLSDYAWPGNVRELINVVERLVVAGGHDVIMPDDLPPEIKSAAGSRSPAWRERRRSMADELYKRVTEEGQSFWTAVYPLYMRREITRGNVRELVGKGFQEARGNYKIVARLFNMEPGDYKRFLNFLRKHDCQLPFQEYR